MQPRCALEDGRGSQSVLFAKQREHSWVPLGRMQTVLSLLDYIRLDGGPWFGLGSVPRENERHVQSGLPVGDASVALQKKSESF